MDQPPTVAYVPVAENPVKAWPKGKVPPHVLEYVDWLVLPESMRQPATKSAWAEEHGFHRRTLTEWEHDDRVRWAIRDKADTMNMSPERIQAVMNALYNKAAQGDVQSMKLYLEHVDKIMPRDEPGSKSKGYEDMSDEELAELAREVLHGDNVS